MRRTSSGPGESLAGQFGYWRQSFTTNWERAAAGLLILICVTTIFSTALVQTFVVALTIVVLAWNFSDRSLEFRLTPFDLPYLAFIAGRVLSILFSRDPALSLPALYTEFFYYIVFFLVTQSIRRNEIAAASVLVSVLVGAGVIAGVLGTAKVFLSMELRASSTTAGVYTLGGYLCVILPLALLQSPYVDKEGAGWWRWFAPLAICSGIVMTLDRLHWAGIVIILAVAVMSTQRWKALVLFCSGLFLFLLVPSVWLRLERIGQYGDLTAGREIIWAGASQLISEHPIVGFGPRTFASIFPLFHKLQVHGVGSWHNDYLQVFMESGLIGLLPLLWLVIATFYHGYRTIQSPSLSSSERRLAFSLLISIGAVFLLGGVLDTHIGLVFRTLLGLLALLGCPARHRQHESPSFARIWRPAPFTRNS